MTHRARISWILRLAILGSFLPAVATAAPLTFNLSSPTDGLVFTIENLGSAAAGSQFNGDGVTGDTYQVMLTMTTTTAYANSSDLLAAFSLSFADDLDYAALVSGPSISGLSWTF